MKLSFLSLAFALIFVMAIMHAPEVEAKAEPDAVGNPLAQGKPSCSIIKAYSIAELFLYINGITFLQWDFKEFTKCVLGMINKIKLHFSWNEI
ncbi:PREDICTED: pilosulin-4-like [Wasmannia auropunctata]|uniref:pilosulin-4-like n=1 Tax=Wasmannia auropunctata TaxID=64793 RepID=UPI0005EF2960|nr:PREDICTED: pilosulin-4-like [Wasmannia auropunctata]